ncbi:hypothetical protein CW752_05050 [Chryseobacterium sp. PMSZPI]|nr:hypothetical protein CW752_05050 [Chryseobacterium sp. PMSZPI]
MKLNKGKDIDITYPQSYISAQKTKTVIKETIKNNTNNTYIIDPYGFYGESYTLENNKILKPYMYINEGYVSRNDRLCRETLIILKPKESILLSLVLNTNNKSVYKYSKTNKYEEVIKSLHNKYNATLLGCDDYIEELESKGYKVLEDSIVAKIPLIP